MIADRMALLGGIFSGQPLGAQSLPLGLLGQAWLLQAAPGTVRKSNSFLVDESESSFEACFVSLVGQDYVRGTIRKQLELVLSSVSRNFWILRDRQSIFSYIKDCSYLFLESRVDYHRGCLKTQE